MFEHVTCIFSSEITDDQKFLEGVDLLYKF